MMILTGNIFWVFLVMCVGAEGGTEDNYLAFPISLIKFRPSQAIIPHSCNDITYLVPFFKFLFLFRVRDC